MIWLAYYSDWSGLAVFSDELEALRYAVKHSMEVAHVEFGEDLREQVSRQFVPVAEEVTE